MTGERHYMVNLAGAKLLLSGYKQYLKCVNELFEANDHLGYIESMLMNAFESIKAENIVYYEMIIEKFPDEAHKQSLHAILNVYRGRFNPDIAIASSHTLLNQTLVFYDNDKTKDVINEALSNVFFIKGQEALIKSLMDRAIEVSEKGKQK